MREKVQRLCDALQTRCVRIGWRFIDCVSSANPYNCVVGCSACANLCEAGAIHFPTKEELVAAIGAPLPTPNEIQAVTETPSRTEERFERLPEEGCRWCGSSESTGPPLIYLAYFYQPGCQECDRAELDLKFPKTRYPQLVVSFDARAEAALLEWLDEATAVPEEKRLTAPAVFVGRDALVGQGVNAREMEALLARYVVIGADPIWRDFDPNASAASIVRRFRSLGVFTVIGAGLLDGVNPCAFTTIVFIGVGLH